MLRPDHRAWRHVLHEAQAVFFPPVGDAQPPLGDVRRARLLLPRSEQRGEDAPRVADDGNIDRDILVDAGRIDIGVDFQAAGAEGAQAPRHAVIETRADIEHDVTAMHGHVGFVGAVHAQHAEELRIAAGKGAEAHQRGGAGEAGAMHEAREQRGGVRPGVDDAAAHVNDRPARPTQSRHGARDGGRVRLGHRAVAAVRAGSGRAVGRGADQHVLGQIDHHRPGPAAARDGEGLVHDARQIGAAADEVIVLGRLARDAGGVGLLERVVADQMRGHLPGQADDGDAVHQRVQQAGDRVGRTRTAGDQHHADTAGAARVALGSVHGGLFVTNEDMADGGLLVQRVIDRQHGAAGIAEDDIDTLVPQGVQQGVRAAMGWMFRHEGRPLLAGQVTRVRRPARQRRIAESSAYLPSTFLEIAPLRLLAH